MIRRLCCFVAVCDDCDDLLGNDDCGYTLHFTTDREVLDQLTAHSWTLDEDGHLRCPVCAARNFCASLDHLWDVWRICECGGAIPAHAENGCGLYRSCAQCGAIDIADLANLPTTGQHHRRGR